MAIMHAHWEHPDTPRGPEEEEEEEDRLTQENHHANHVLFRVDGAIVSGAWLGARPSWWGEETKGRRRYVEDAQAAYDAAYTAAQRAL